jgi:phosphatidylglycerol:prolipoprotein diacylglycerol transferase
MLYAIGRYALEYFRGDIERGFIIKDYLSHSQFIALAIFVVVVYVYNRWSKRNLVSLHKKPI